MEHIEFKPLTSVNGCYLKNCTDVGAVQQMIDVIQEWIKKSNELLNKWFGSKLKKKS